MVNITRTERRAEFSIITIVERGLMTLPQLYTTTFFLELSPTQHGQAISLCLRK